MSAIQLEAFNGVWAILATFCAVFLVDHLWAITSRLPTSWLGIFLKMPKGLQLAVASFGVCAGVALSRGSIWFWRWAFDGDPGRLNDVNIPHALGAFIGSVGFLCMLRVVSRPRGHWPVAAAVLTVFAYLATFLRYL